MSTIILRALDDSLGLGRCEIPEGRAQTDVGRAAECAIVLPSKSVSRVHARFERKGAELVLHDLGSSNGTAVNGKPIQEPVAVHVGDRVRFGSLEFVLEEQTAPEDDAATLLAPPAKPSPATMQTIDGAPPEAEQRLELTPTAAPPPPPREPTSMTVAKVRDPAKAEPAPTPARAAPKPSGAPTPFGLALIAIGAYVTVVAAGLAIRWVFG